MATHPDSESDDYSDAAGLLPDGASAIVTLQTDPSAAGERLDRYVAMRLADVSRAQVQRWILLGAVEVDGAARAAKTRLAGCERIRVARLPREADGAFLPDPVPLRIVHEDDDLMVIDKPAGLVVHPAAGNWRGTLLNGLLHHRPDSAQLPRAGIVHRLDKDTSGLMAVARSERAVARLVAQLAQRTAKRRYLALVEGTLDEPLTVDAPIGRDPAERVRMATLRTGGKPARTHLQPVAHGVIETVPVTLVLCRLETGRTHQIRVHLRHVGRPIVGDAVYGRRLARAAAIDRQALHAWRLALRHPADEAAVQWESPPPDDLTAALRAAGIEAAGALASAHRWVEADIGAAGAD